MQSTGKGSVSETNRFLKGSGEKGRKLWESKRLRLGHIKDSFGREEGMGRGNSSGHMVNTIQGNGRTTKSMEVGTGNLRKGVAIWVNGTMDRYQDMVSIP